MSVLTAAAALVALAVGLTVASVVVSASVLIRRSGQYSFAPTARNIRSGDELWSATSVLCRKKDIQAVD